MLFVGPSLHVSSNTMPTTLHTVCSSLSLSFVGGTKQEAKEAEARQKAAEEKAEAEKAEKAKKAAENGEEGGHDHKKEHKVRCRLPLTTRTVLGLDSSPSRSFLRLAVVIKCRRLRRRC